MNLTFTKNRLRGIGFTLVDNIRKDLRASDKEASGTLIKDTKFKIVEIGTNIALLGLAPFYWFFVDQGRKKGKQPPTAPILRWINQKGIEPDGISKKSLAYLIARKIGKEGTQGTNIFTDNSRKVSGEITSFVEALNKDVTNESRKIFIDGFNRNR